MKVPEPEMGENTIEILDELGYSKNDISDLMQKGAISCPKANLWCDCKNSSIIVRYTFLYFTTLFSAVLMIQNIYQSLGYGYFVFGFAGVSNPDGLELLEDEESVGGLTFCSLFFFIACWMAMSTSLPHPVSLTSNLRILLDWLTPVKDTLVSKKVTVLRRYF